MGKSKDLATLKTSGLSIDDGGLSVKDAHSQLTLTDSDDDKFVLTSYSGGKYVVRNNSTSTTTNQFTLTEDGKFGVGTISPPRLLSLFGTGAGNATMQIEGEGGADPTINFLANNAQHWAIGIDDSDSDAFKISEHSALGTNDYLKVDVSGRVTMPSQPAFFAYSTASNAVTSGAISADFNAVLTNVGGHFNTSSKRFVAPVAGSYFFSVSGQLASHGASAHEYALGIFIRKNGNTFKDQYGGNYGAGTSPQYITVVLNAVMSLAANDYVDVEFNLPTTVNVEYSGGTKRCTFIGYLLG